MILKAISDGMFLRRLNFVYQIELVKSLSTSRLIRFYCVDSSYRRVNIILKPVLYNENDINTFLNLRQKSVLNYISKKYLNSYLFFDTELWNVTTKRIHQTLYDNFYLNKVYSVDSFFNVRAIEISDSIKNNKRVCLIKTVDKLTENEMLGVMNNNTVYTTLPELIINAIEETKTIIYAERLDDYPI